MASITANPYIFLVVLALSVINLILYAKLRQKVGEYEQKRMALTDNGEDQNLEDVAAKLKKASANHTKNLKELGVIMSELVEQNRRNIQKVGVVRYNPFGDAGGNMSFAIALLDRDSNGIVISSLHAREGTRVYAKAIADGKSEHHLTDEEKKAISTAGKTRPKKS